MGCSHVDLHKINEVVVGTIDTTDSLNVIYAQSASFVIFTWGSKKKESFDLIGWFVLTESSGGGREGTAVR